VKITTPLTAGDANFTTYMAIGNSLTAGYSDGSLYATGQLNSYPERLYEQFSLLTDRPATGGFYQPLLSTDQGYPGAKLVLGYTAHCIGDTTLGPVNYPGFSGPNANDAAYYTSTGPNGQINNIGVPGIRVADYPVPGYATNNPYSARFYKYLDATHTPQDELKYRVATLHPSFFTMWLGANDVLGFATAGGTGDGTMNAAPWPGTNFYGQSDITPQSVFFKAYDSAVATAVSTGARGALINIPDVTTIPYFTTVPANGLYLSRQGQVDTLTAFYADSTTHPVFKLGYNYFIVQDHNNNWRQAIPGELLILTTPQDSITCAGWGTVRPIPNQYVLTTEEIQQIRTATTIFNNHIASTAALNNLALVDMNTYLGTVASGITYNGINYNAQFVTGGAFSLDGIHLTPRGYAIVANKIISTINAKYNSTIPMIDVNQYHGVLFP